MKTAAERDAFRDTLVMYLALLVRGNVVTEGFAPPSEHAYLTSLIAREMPRAIAEIGFNAGFSAYALLKGSPDSHVVSFDLGEHYYVHAGKRYIDAVFPGRHILILGDSRETLPRYRAEHPNALFDLVFIDGGHSYEVAHADLINMRTLCKPGARVVMDDIIPWKKWGVGPTKAWKEVVAKGIVQEDGLFDSGTRVSEPKKRWRQHVWAEGAYI